MSMPGTAFPVGPSLLTEAALCAWVGSAVPGDRVIYHRGFLACDAALHLPASKGSTRKELLRMRARARALAELGLVDLLQQRHEEGQYSYLLVVRRRSPRSDQHRQVTFEDLTAEVAG